MNLGVIEFCICKDDILEVFKYLGVIYKIIGYD